MRFYLLACLLLCVPVVAAADTRVPSGDSEVLLRVLAQDDPALQALREALEALRARPDDLTVALRYAQQAIEMGRHRDDPRWYGYAQAALDPWWSQHEPPIEVRVLRATLAQNRHAFRAALDDLDTVIASDPQHVQARLTRAVIHTVQARYAAARQDCAALMRHGALLAVTCAANAASLGGDAEGTWQALGAALKRGGGDDATLLWALTLRAELAERLGRTDTETHYRAALDAAGGSEDRYLHIAYADWLLDRGRAREVLTLLDALGDNDGIVLRRAMARRQRVAAGDDSQATPLAAEQRLLQERFAAERRRGGQLHLREAAMLALHVDGDAEAALWLARDNFREQREPSDARVLMRAALESGAPEAAKPAIGWMQQHRIEDARLEPLRDQVKRHLQQDGDAKP